MDQRLAVDDRLPLLPLIYDFEQVAELFSAALPFPVRVRRALDVKYEPGTRCVVAYALEDPAGEAAPTIGVVEVGPDGARPRLFRDDPRLPWLPQLLDADAMGLRFAALAPALGVASVDGCQATPIRYRSGVRCVVRYDLETGDGPRVVFGKALREGGPELKAVLEALHAAAETDPQLPRILPPLAYWDDLRMLLQPAVVGALELNDRVFAEDEPPALRERWLHEAGLRLGALHRSAAVGGPERRWADDLAELEGYLPPIAQCDPPLAARYGALLAALANLGEGRAERLVASHGAFRTDQFLIEAGELVMIDLDGFCWANACRDIGNFLAYVRWKQIRQPARAGFIGAGAPLFLAGYRAAGSPPDPHWLALYTADSLLKIAGRRYRSLTVKEWPLVPRLLDAAERELAALRS